jgi:hypothetical protein
MRTGCCKSAAANRRIDKQIHPKSTSRLNDASGLARAGRYGRKSATCVSLRIHDNTAPSRTDQMETDGGGSRFGAIVAVICVGARHNGDSHLQRQVGTLGQTHCDAEEGGQAESTAPLLCISRLVELPAARNYPNPPASQLTCTASRRGCRCVRPAPRSSGGRSQDNCARAYKAGICFHATALSLQQGQSPRQATPSPMHNIKSFAQWLSHKSGRGTGPRRGGAYESDDEPGGHKGPEPQCL